MITNPKITINQIDTNIQSMITWSSSANKSFGDLSLLNVSGKESPNFATLELNEYILDSQLGRYVENIAFMSDGLSDDECLFGSVWVEATLSEAVDIYITSIEFGENYPKKVSIEKYLNNDLIGTEIIDNIDEKTIFSRKPVIGANKLRINFLESWAPYQYAHLQSWIFGGDIIFSGDNISELTLNETTDPISNRLEVDAAHISILDKYNNFNLLENSDINKFIKVGTEVNISVNIIDGENEKDVYLGKYYIKEVKFDVNHSMILECETFLGLMDKIKFPGLGTIIFSDDTPIEQCNLQLMLNRVFESALNGLNIDLSRRAEYYEISGDLSQIRVYGYIPVMSCREALRNLAFVHNLTIKDNRNRKIIIEKYVSKDEASTVGSNRITSRPTFEEHNKIGNATSTINRYFLSNETKEILNVQKVLPNIPEDYELSTPYKYEYYEAIAPGGTQIQVNFFHTTNVVILQRSGSIFILKVFGEEYSNDPIKYTKNFEVSDGKSVEISDSKLITSSNVTEVIDNFVNFYNENYLKLKLEYVNISEETGNCYKLDLKEDIFTGYLTYQSLDVAHGMIANAEFIGKVKTN